MSAINFSFHRHKPVRSRRSLVLSRVYARRNEIECCTTMSFLLVTVCLVMVLFMSMMTRAYALFFIYSESTATFMDAIDAAGTYDTFSHSQRTI